MIGRIYKEKGNFYCIIGMRKIPLLLSSENKLKNGDLVKINPCLNFNKHFPEMIKNSQLTILKSIHRKNVPNLNQCTSLHDRLKYRVLDLRRLENHSLFILKSELIKYLRNFFDKNGFIEVITPTILGKITEGRVKKFEIDFYGKKAFLAMTKLPSLCLLICADFPKVYENSSLFVGGSQNTRYHVSEFYVLDWATSDNVNLRQQINFIDTCLTSLIHHLIDYLKTKQLKTFGLKNLLSDKKRAVVISYNELIKKYLRDFPEDKKVENQYHIPQRVINYISKIIGDYFWVIEFPEKFKQFYCKTEETDFDKKIVLAGELWWRNIKVASVSISESDSREVRERLKILGLSERNFKIYLNALHYATNEAALGSIYLDRLTMGLFKLKNIREGILFPRSYKGSILEP